MPFDTEAYLRRLGLPEPAAGVVDLPALHRAHVSSIVFENLDPRRGLRVELSPEALQAKLVAGRRGGYCFEQNLLFAHALAALVPEAGVEPMLARVRWNRAAGTPRPKTHLLLRITGADGRAWHADVGFGNGTLLEPIPFGVGGPYEQSGWRFRVVAEGEALVLQTERAGAWVDVYEFLPRPVSPIDIELSNWYTSTHPDSAFVRGLVVARTGAQGARLVLSDLRGELRLRELTPGGSEETIVDPGDLVELLAARFELPDPGALLRGAERR